ncbi:hypothetical protein HanRHA438_Chr02g0055521 [Helianthus annuus]|nr:hypothetical protein HanRHA438_Chr02g0055521 [Helianthus annuus]
MVNGSRGLHGEAPTDFGYGLGNQGTGYGLAKKKRVKHTLNYGVTPTQVHQL